MPRFLVSAARLGRSRLPCDALDLTLLVLTTDVNYFIVLIGCVFVMCVN